MIKSKQNQLILALVCTAGPIPTRGAYSLSQTISQSRGPIFVNESSGGRPTAVKLGVGGQPATSTSQDLELTRQLIMAHFDAMDMAREKMEKSITTLQGGKEVPMASEKLALDLDADESVSLGNDFTNIPSSVGKGAVDSIQSGKRGIWHAFATKGKNLCGRIFGKRKSQPKDMATIATS